MASCLVHQSNSTTMKKRNTLPDLTDICMSRCWPHSLKQILYSPYRELTVNRLTWAPGGLSWVILRLTGALVCKCHIYLHTKVGSKSERVTRDYRFRQRTLAVRMTLYDPVWFQSKKRNFHSTHLQFTKRRQQPSSISLDFSFLSTQTKLDSEPIELKETRKAVNLAKAVNYFIKAVVQCKTHKRVTSHPAT